MINVYYRISSESHDKARICSKEESLINFINCSDWDNINVIADNCDDATIEMLQTHISAGSIEQSKLGNSKSFVHALNRAIQENDDDDIIYFVEDDYLHRKQSKAVIVHGLSDTKEVPVDYLTLYDHPDKYRAEYNFAEDTKVFLRGVHFKYTISTTMTFAAKVKTLKEDAEYWRYGCKYSIPEDHRTFVQLGRLKHRKIAVPLPGYATHTETINLAPTVPWKNLI